MNIKDFTTLFCDQFDDAINVPVAPSTKFRELEQWSSLTALNVLSMIVDEYGVELDPDEMRKTNTIEELFDLVHSKL